MGFIRLVPPSINIHHVNSDHRNQRSLDTSQRSTPRRLFSASTPTLIPRKDMSSLATSPLPPPPHIADLDTGRETGWLHAHRRGSTETCKLAPINQTQNQYMSQGQGYTSRGDQMQVNQIALPQSRDSENQSAIDPPSPLHVDGGVRSPPNGPGILEGERDFSRRSVKDSSNAYDQHLLSKIGKPLSPKQSITQGGRSGGRGSLSTLSIPLRSFVGLPSPGADGSTLETRWQSPQSGGVSPSGRAAWKDYSDCRSPSADSSAPSSAVDFDHPVYSRAVTRRRGVSLSQFSDSFSLPSRSNRGSYDQGAFSDAEGECAPDDPLQSRYFINLREATPPYLDASRAGSKRRASSPPRELIGDRRHSLRMMTSSGDLSQRRTTGYPSTSNLSIGSGYALSHESISTSSLLSIRTSASYSSTGLSAGGSSMPSTSPYARLSSVGMSLSDPDLSLHGKSMLQPGSPGGFSGQSSIRIAPATVTLESPNPNHGKNAPQQPSLAGTVQAPTKAGGLYLCECCPKKPKKFDNPEDLRAHEMEKQYSCQFCSNRFKNKNEAERHQNSLHLRNHSWSCAALPSYHAAFHASGSPSAQTSSGPSHDVCGYCGEEFANMPQPDWDRRFEHLTSVHKFGECNNAKKFYRADHFRQHLKHSHAGTSGKWTNILENMCMKEENPSELRADRTSGHLGSEALSSNSIDEALHGCV